MSVLRSECILRFEVRDGDDNLLSTAWRCAPAPRPPSGFPESAPFLAGVSCTAVEEAEGLTVNWPDPEESTVEVGGFSLPDLGGLLGGAARRDPVGEAWSRFTTEGAVNDRFESLEAGYQSIVAHATDDGWILEEEEKLAGPLPGRIARLTLGSRRRNLTLSAALGVASLVLMERSTGHG